MDSTAATTAPEPIDASAAGPPPLRVVSADELRNARRKWTSAPYTSTRTGPETAPWWTWLISWTRRMRNPSARIPVYADARTFFVGSDARTMLSLLRDVGYTGSRGRVRVSRRLISPEDAQALYAQLEALEDENATEQAVETGLKVGGFAATTKIEEQLRAERDVALARLDALEQTLSALRENANGWEQRAMRLENEVVQLSDALTACKISQEDHASKLQQYVESLELAEPPPLPEAEPVPDAASFDMPLAPPPPPPAQPLYAKASDTLQAMRDSSVAAPAVAHRTGVATTVSMQEELKQVSLKPVTPATTAVADVPAQGSLERGLTDIVAKFAVARGDDDDVSEFDDDDDDAWLATQYLAHLVSTCAHCGRLARVACECTNALYCGERCKEAHWSAAHALTCEAQMSGAYIGRAGSSEDDEVRIGIVVRPKADADYVGMHATQGSPMAYKVVLVEGAAAADNVRFGEHIVLNKDTTYTFVAYDNSLEEHPFYISLNARGATHTLSDQIALHGDDKVLRKLGSAFTFKPGRDLEMPRDVVYAACDKHPFMGFPIRIQ